MAKLLKLQLGVSDDATAFQPSLNDCLEAILQQATMLMTDVVNGLTAASSPNSPRRISGFQQPSMKMAIASLSTHNKEVCESFKVELSRLVYEGGGKEQVHSEMLRFEDLQLFEDSELDQSIEVARAQQEVQLAVDDSLPALDALMSTLLGWRTIQPGLNPLRPDVFVRALQTCLSVHVPDAPVREAIIAPAAGLLGVNLRRLYRELTDWLRSCGVEPAVPIGGRVQRGGAATTAGPDAMTKTLLTLDKLRKLLAGDFDPKAGQRDFIHTMPASFVALQDLKQVDAMVQRLEKRPPKPAPAPAPDASGNMVAPPPEASTAPRVGHQLGEEVVRLMFDNLAQDQRLLPEFKTQLRAIEPAVLNLARQDSRFFSDRAHPARQFLDRITQRSIGFTSAGDDGWRRFLATVETAVTVLNRKEPDADAFGQLLDDMQTHWTEHDQGVRQRREEGARALLHAEQRNLLAQKLAADFATTLEGLEVAEFVAEFLKSSWAQVVAEAQLSCADGSDDPYGYRALADDLIWSVQKSTAQRGRTRRLAKMIPGLLSKLREGLHRIDYPDELTKRFFDGLITIHEAALQEGREAAAAARAVAAASGATPEAQTEFAESTADPVLWVAGQEAVNSGYVAEEEAVPDPAGIIDSTPEDLEEPEPAHAAELRTGTWVELMVNGGWTRVQLTWSSPHSTLFMFTSQAGTAHSMSRRTLERLRSQGLIKVVADRNVVDEALDQVAKTALKNSLDGKS